MAPARPPFVVLTLPRSRSFWLSRFLSYGGWTCGHDEILHIRAMDDVRSWFAQPLVGSVETAGAPFWRLMMEVRPDVRVVVVRRPVHEMVESAMRLGIPFNRDVLTRNFRLADLKLQQVVNRVPGVLEVSFADLATEATCARVFEHCLGMPHDAVWWQRLAGVNLQRSMAAEIRYEAAHAPQLRRAAGMCKQHMLASMWRNRPEPDLSDGITFQEETLEDFYRDGQALFREHCVAVGEAPDEYRRKNLPLIERLASREYIQFMTARCNGRMFGYLATVLAPSLESTEFSVATQTLFYASPDVRGLGLRLQRAAVKAIEARGGVWDVIQRAGVRGSGPRMDALYRRMGAEDYGHLYRLRVGAA